MIFVVNRISEIHARQTTAMLIERALARDNEVFVAEAREVTLGPDDGVRVSGRFLRRGHRNPIANRLTDARRSDLLLASGDAVVVRTNPGRDPEAWPHLVLLDLLRIARESGAWVFNDPAGLARATSKLYVTSLPRRFRPRTLVSRDAATLQRFVEDADGPTVLKPLVGTRGTDVFIVDRSQQNLPQIVDVLTRQGFAMVQDFVPGAAQGDVRIMLLDGEPLVAGDGVCVVRRVPRQGDFRSNVHLDGRPEPVEFTAELRELADAVGPRIAADGLSLVGLDVIDGLVVEVNAWSPGCLCDSNAFYGVDFTVPVVERFERPPGCARGAEPWHFATLGGSLEP